MHRDPNAPSAGQIAVNTVTDGTVMGSVGQAAMALMVSPVAAGVIGLRGCAGLILRYLAERDIPFENKKIEALLADERNPLAMNGLWTLTAAAVAASSMDWTNPVSWLAFGSLALAGAGNTAAGLGQRIYHAFNREAETPRALDPDLYWIGARGIAAGAAYPVAVPVLGAAAWQYFRHGHDHGKGPAASFWRSSQVLTAGACFGAAAVFAAQGEWGMASTNLFLGLATLSNAVTLRFGGVAQALSPASGSQQRLQPA